MGKVLLHCNNVNPKLNDRVKLKQFINYIFKTEKKFFFQVDFVFCNDDYLLNINQQSLKHDYYTDIITFDISLVPTDIVGEIYISIDRIKENANTYSVTYFEELHRVIFHGILHLCGYKDKLAKDKTLMKQKENAYLKQYFRK